jgi:peptide/nickel transport system permease protein
MRHDRALWLSATLLTALHLLVLVAGFVAPYDPTTQHRTLPYAPPTRVRLIDRDGAFHLRPFIYPQVPRRDTGTSLKARTTTEGEGDSRRPFPLRFFVRGNEYTLLGVFHLDRHLIAVDEPARLFLLGSDEYGRDILSRVLYGGQISLLAGWAAALLSLGLGLLLGLVAGFYGRWLDDVVMRVTELFLALPWLYLLFAARAFLPLHLEARAAFLLIVALVGVIGWARPARLIRGVVLSARERVYVAASRGFGATDVHLLRRHVLPHTYGILLTQAAILIPHYMLAEITLSFFGLGVAEPTPSWGNVLAGLQRYHVLASYWWMFLPAVLLVAVTLTCQVLASALHERLKGAV